MFSVICEGLKTGSLLPKIKILKRMYKKLPKKRYERTLAILKKYAPQGATILDVGVVNPFSELM